MSVFFTADQHFQHTWMAQYRGFSYTEAHDKQIIKDWNDTVKGGDVVIVIGDVFWHGWSIEWYLNMWNKVLKGTKILVKGNHDRWVKKVGPDSIRGGVRRIYQRLMCFRMDKQYVVCCHYPIEGWNRKKYGAIHLHGHSHGKSRPLQGRLDVGVDVAKIMLGAYRPFSMEEIMYLIKGVTYERN